jgi:hypothetical protein
LEDTEPRFESPTQDIRLHRQDDDHPNGDQLEKDIDVEKIKRVSDDPNHQRTDKCVSDMTPTAEEARTSNNDGRYRIELGQVAK